MKNEYGKYYNEYPAKALRSLYNNGKGFKLQDVADALGVSRQSIGFYLNGTNQPTIGNLIKLVDYFHVSFDYLLGKTESRKPERDLRNAAEITGLSDDAIDALIKIKEVSKEVSREIERSYNPNSEENSAVEDGMPTDILNLIITSPDLLKCLLHAGRANILYRLALFNRLDEGIPDPENPGFIKGLKPLEYYIKPIIKDDYTIDSSGTHAYESILKSALDIMCKIVTEATQL